MWDVSGALSPWGKDNLQRPAGGAVLGRGSAFTPPLPGFYSRGDSPLPKDLREVPSSELVEIVRGLIVAPSQNAEADALDELARRLSALENDDSTFSVGSD